MRKHFLRKHWFEIILVIVVMGVHLFAATSDALNFPSNWFTRDDAYYYFKVAQNISQGHGSTFDRINLTNGYHPLWMLVNIPIFALARYDLILPLRIMLLLQAALSVGTGVLIYRLARGAISEPVGVMAASWWVFSPYIHATMYEFGLETALASFAVALLLHQLYRFELTWRIQSTTLKGVAGLALLALLALFSRLDLVFLAVLVGPWVILRGTSIRVLVLLDMMLAVSSIFASFTSRLGFPEYYNYATAAVAMAAISAATKLVLYFLVGLYQKSLPSTDGHAIPAANSSSFAGGFTQRLMRAVDGGLWTAGMVQRIVLAVSLSTLLTAGVMPAAVPLVGSFPRASLLMDWGINLAGMLALRGLWRFFTPGADGDTTSPLALLKSRWQDWLKEALTYYATIGIPLGLYLLFNRLVIGTAMPVSGQIKRWWAAAGSRAYGGAARSSLEFWATDPSSEFNAWRPFSDGLGLISKQITDWRGGYRSEGTYTGLLILLGLFWLLVLLMRRRKAVRAAMLSSLPLLFTASVFQILSYNASGYAAVKEWYWIAEPMFLGLALGIAVWILVEPLRMRQSGRTFLWLITGLAGLGMALNFTGLIYARMPHGDHPAAGAYMDSVAFLEENTPPGSLIGMTGGGNVGYYIRDRTIVNMDGLINSPAYFDALKIRNASQYLQACGLNYIFANPTILAATPYFGQYATGRELGRFGGKSLMEFSP